MHTHREWQTGRDLGYVSSSDSHLRRYTSVLVRKSPSEIWQAKIIIFSMHQRVITLSQPIICQKRRMIRHPDAARSWVDLE